MDAQSASNIISLWEIARTHHQQLTTFYVTVVLGVIGVSFTEAFAKVVRWQRIVLSAGFIVCAVAVVGSLVANARLQNKIVSEAMLLPQPKAGEPDLKAVFALVGPTPEFGLAVMHTAIALVALVFINFRRDTTGSPQL